MGEVNTRIENIVKEVTDDFIGHSFYSGSSKYQEASWDSFEVPGGEIELYFELQRDEEENIETLLSGTVYSKNFPEGISINRWGNGKETESEQKKVLKKIYSDLKNILDDSETYTKIESIVQDCMEDYLTQVPLRDMDAHHASRYVEVQKKDGKIGLRVELYREKGKKLETLVHGSLYSEDGRLERANIRASEDTETEIKTAMQALYSSLKFC